MNQCCYFRVSGRVQGVYYRGATQEKARSLGLTGWVRNLADGDVELLARGEETALNALETWLWEGPPRAQVTGVLRHRVEDEVYRNFEIRR